MRRATTTAFANSTLWPLCHQVFCRPTFEPLHWETYRKVNETFAAAVLEEAARWAGAGVRSGLPFRPPAAPPESGPARSRGRPVLAHPVAEHGEVPGLPVGEGDSRRDARQRPAWLPHAARLQQLPRDGRPGAGVPDRSRDSSRSPAAVTRRASAHSRSASIPTLRRSTSGQDWESRAATLRKKYRLGEPAAARGRRSGRLHEGNSRASACRGSVAARSTRS